jgi:hypothetical protein
MLGRATESCVASTDAGTACVPKAQMNMNTQLKKSRWWRDHRHNLETIQRPSLLFCGVFAEPLSQQGLTGTSIFKRWRAKIGAKARVPVRFVYALLWSIGYRLIHPLKRQQTNKKK